jgi:flagellar FliL protein
VFNVPGASRDRIVQIKVQLLVRGDVNEEVAKKHIPLIEGTLLSVFSTTTADELSTTAGKETLRLTALDKVQQALTAVEGSKVVERVLFTGFVMQ